MHRKTIHHNIPLPSSQSYIHHTQAIPLSYIHHSIPCFSKTSIIPKNEDWVWRTEGTGDASAPKSLRAKSAVTAQLVVSTQGKNISQIGSFPQLGVKINNIWNHHLEEHACQQLWSDYAIIWDKCILDTLRMIDHAASFPIIPSQYSIMFHHYLISFKISIISQPRQGSLNSHPKQCIVIREIPSKSP